MRSRNGGSEFGSRKETDSRRLWYAVPSLRDSFWGGGMWDVVVPSRCFASADHRRSPWRRVRIPYRMVGMSCLLQGNGISLQLCDIARTPPCRLQWASALGGKPDTAQVVSRTAVSSLLSCTVGSLRHHIYSLNRRIPLLGGGTESKTSTSLAPFSILSHVRASKRYTPPKSLRNGDLHGQSQIGTTRVLTAGVEHEKQFSSSWKA